MDFIQQLNTWAKGDAFQGKLMIGTGIIILIIFITFFRSKSELLQGMLIPLGLMFVVLLGYGSYILFSRPAHVNTMQVLYEKNPKEALQIETVKQEIDYKSCKTLIKVYPILMLVGVIALIFIPSPYFKGLALGFVLLFITAYFIDSGFASRSLPFLQLLKPTS
jgi:hypothetical protein